MTSQPVYSNSNPLDAAPLLRWIVIALVMGACGLLFVSVKNQQHKLGQATREIERRISEERAANEVLVARISTLTSHTELRRKLQEGIIALIPIQDNCIARLLPPAVATGGGGLARAGANEQFRP